MIQDYLTKIDSAMGQQEQVMTREQEMQLVKSSSDFHLQNGDLKLVACVQPMRNFNNTVALVLPRRRRDYGVATQGMNFQDQEEAFQNLMSLWEEKQLRKLEDLKTGFQNELQKFKAEIRKEIDVEKRTFQAKILQLVKKKLRKTMEVHSDTFKSLAYTVKEETEPHLPEFEFDSREIEELLAGFDLNEFGRSFSDDDSLLKFLSDSNGSDLKLEDVVPCSNITDSYQNSVPKQANPDHSSTSEPIGEKQFPWEVKSYWSHGSRTVAIRKCSIKLVDIAKEDKVPRQYKLKLSSDTRRKLNLPVPRCNKGVSGRLTRPMTERLLNPKLGDADEDNPKRFACEYCVKRYSNLASLIRHVAQHPDHGIEKMKKRYKPKVMISCYFCKDAIPKALWVSHFRCRHKGRRLKCKFCWRPFKKSWTLNRHLNVYH